MVTIRQAINLLGIKRHTVIFIQKRSDNAASIRKTVTIKKLCDRLDIKHSFVYKIETVFDFSGSFIGFCFILDNDIYDKIPLF